MNDPVLLVLASLAEGDKHGYAMMDDIQRFANIRLSPGTLYGTIIRLEQRGWIRPLKSEDRRQPYCITAVGRTYLSARLACLDDVVKTGLARLRAQLEDPSDRVELACGCCNSAKRRRPYVGEGCAIITPNAVQPAPLTNVADQRGRADPRSWSARFTARRLNGCSFVSCVSEPVGRTGSTATRCIRVEHPTSHRDEAYLLRSENLARDFLAELKHSGVSSQKNASSPRSATARTAVGANAGAIPFCRGTMLHVANAGLSTTNTRLTCRLPAA